MAEEEEDDILAALGVPPAKPKAVNKPPPRPPPPAPSRAYTEPVMSMGYRKQGSDKLYIPPPLQPHEVRWFYLEPGKFWQPFAGYDSLRLEQSHLDLMGWGLEGPAVLLEDGEAEINGQVSVMGDLYAVLLQERLMVPIYWPSGKDKWKVMRGYWFEVVGDKWYPFLEADCTFLEEEHCQRKWREMAKKDAELQSWVSSPARSVGSSSTSSASGGRSLSTSSVPSSSSLTSSSSASVAPPPPTETPEDTTVVVNKLAMEKYDIVWLANGDVHKMKKELSSQLWNKMGQKFGKGALFGGTKVMRGYKDFASGEDRLPPIGHVVFVTHGIGQTMDASSIEQSTRDFREAADKVAKNCFADLWNEKRVEFIPVEWRTGLSLDEGLVNTITPSSLKLLRSLVNDCVMDVFYYFSPKFGPEILNGLKTALQKQHDEFMRRNPYFLANGGTVSVIAHSLGSVMLYDILREKCDIDPEIRATLRAASRQSSMASSRQGSLVSGSTIGGGAALRGMEYTQGLPDTSMEYVDGEVVEEEVSEEAAMRKELAALKKKVAYLEHQLILKKTPEPLTFSIDHFFAFGSPTALFIAMKEYETLVTKGHRSAESFLPACVCKRIHNVQHPSDPIAYRLEPLVNPNYAKVKPVKMCSAKSKISQDMVDLAEGPRLDRDLEGQQQSGKSWLANQLSSVGTSIIKFASGKKASAALTGGGGGDGSEPSHAPPPEKVLDSDKQLHPRVKLKERLDFTLKESVMENSYLNAITAHQSYWSSADCAQYVLLQLYTYKPTP